MTTKVIHFCDECGRIALETEMIQVDIKIPKKKDEDDEISSFGLMAMFASTCRTKELHFCSGKCYDEFLSKAEREILNRKGKASGKIGNCFKA